MSRFPGSKVALALLFVVTHDAHAQLNPLRWTLGIFDDPGLTRSEGAMLAPTKELWIGARARVTPGEGFVGFEFGVAGLEPFTIVSAEWIPPAIIVLGNIAAPADTMNGSGGLNVAWTVCIPSDQAFLKLVVATPSPPKEHVLRITRRYPPADPARPFPYGASCDACGFCWSRVVTSDYVLNPTIAVQPAGWASIKGLYRAR